MSARTRCSGASGQERTGRLSAVRIAEPMSVGFCPKDIWERGWPDFPGPRKVSEDVRGLHPGSLPLAQFQTPAGHTLEKTVVKIRKLKRKTVSFGQRCFPYRWEEVGI